MVTRARSVSLALLAIVLSASAGAARADNADALRAEGKKLLADGKVDAACAKLDESQRMAPQSATLFELAGCHEKQGRVATAWIEYLDVATQARKEGRADRERAANQRSQALTAKVPRLTLTVPDAVASLAGLEIKVDGRALQKSELGQPLPVDPGERVVFASADGRLAWETRVTLKVGEKKSLAVPALAERPAEAALPPPPAAGPAKPAEKPAPAVPEHRAKRVVVEVSLQAAFLFGGVNDGSVSEIEGVTYPYLAKDAEYPQICGKDNCKASVSPSPSVLFGGQLFVGYATSERVQLGGRFMGGPRIRGGYFVAGGPAASFGVTPSLWLGVTALGGFMQQPAQISGLRGKGPSGIPAADGTDEVQISLKGVPEEAVVSSSAAFGAAFEISYVLVDVARPSGSLMFNAWPTFLYGINGYVVSVPVGFGYRFY